MEILFSVFVVTGGVMVGARAMMLSKPEVIRPVAKPLNRTPDRERGWRGSVAAALQMMRHGQSRLETVSMPVCHTTVRPAEMLFFVSVVTAGVVVCARAMMFSKPEVIRAVAKPLNHTPDRERGWRGSHAVALQMMRDRSSYPEMVSSPKRDPTACVAATLVPCVRAQGWCQGDCWITVYKRYYARFVLIQQNIVKRLTILPIPYFLSPIFSFLMRPKISCIVDKFAVSGYNCTQPSFPAAQHMEKYQTIWR
ncbi:hypothetical protein [Chloroflexus sp.]|uniref:hypothetical protein n=1 Tax=Chloroflexus sp. TaxID=1904827 RepID=UPI0025804712|nr:hypothetical protein [Chloroflexus sp.]